MVLKLRLFFEIILISLLIRLCLLFLPFKTVISKTSLDIQLKVKINNNFNVNTFSYLLIKARRIIPWRFKCLEQALTIRYMLKRRNVTSVLYFGLKKESKLEAHSWLEVNNKILIGNENIESYTVISKFI